MYQDIDFSKTGGFPLTQNKMDFIQSSYNEVLAATSHGLGEHIILQGLVESPPNNFSAGWVAIEGEILPFTAGVGTTNIVITETIDNVTYNDGAVNGVLKTRKAGFGAGSIPFASFKRLSLETLKTDITAVETTANNALTVANNALTQVSNTSLPTGAIIMWGGTTPPTGWAICDGTNGTPNLKGRFIVGYDAADNDYNAIGDVGGEKRHVLTSGEMPSHSHTITDPGHFHDMFGQTGGDNNDNSNTRRFAGGDKGATESGFFFTNTSPFNSCQSKTTGISVNESGSNDPHENRPPFYTLAYIIKI